MWSIGSNATNTRNDITQIRCCHQDEQKKALKYLIVKNVLCIKCKKQVINNLSLSRRNYVCLEYLDNMCKYERRFQVYFWSIWTKFCSCGAVGPWASRSQWSDMFAAGRDTLPVKPAATFRHQKTARRLRAAQAGKSGQMSKHANE